MSTVLFSTGKLKNGINCYLAYCDGFYFNFTFIYGNKTPYSGGMRTKSWTLYKSPYSNKFVQFYVDETGSYFLSYHGFYSAIDEIYVEELELDETNCYTEIMKRTKYQIPIQMVREHACYNGLYNYADLGK